jgi:hypothetical protein
MNEKEIKVTVNGHEVVITESMAEALEDLPRENFSIIRDWVAFVDTVSMHLSLSGSYSPSPEGCKMAMQTVVDMKIFLLSLTNEDYYEHYQ